MVTCHHLSAFVIKCRHRPPRAIAGKMPKSLSKVIIGYLWLSAAASITPASAGTCHHLSSFVIICHHRPPRRSAGEVTRSGPDQPIADFAPILSIAADPGTGGRAACTAVGAGGRFHFGFYSHNSRSISADGEACHRRRAPTAGPDRRYAQHGAGDPGPITTAAGPVPSAAPPRRAPPSRATGSRA